MADKHGNKSDLEDAWQKAWPPLLLLSVLIGLAFWAITDHEERSNSQEYGQGH
jgi:hypothetical protein